ALGHVAEAASSRLLPHPLNQENPMKSTWSRSVQMTLCAAAICAMGAVNAQTPQAPASVATPQSNTQTPTQASPSQARGNEGQKADGRKGEHQRRANRGERQRGEQHQGQR